ncbi:prepilin-type N-terminal cleavage/methylation domain-containing protein [Candidatus Nomurabacteria bacterium]|nr:prepilin-type N-terminal cleavage/methylation domain-containing protein [Candidatus Nomurabacteria bacterium]
MKNNQGFTLLEMILALAVVSIGIMGAFTLSLANLNTARDNYNRVLAANLAREGVELVRNIRDSNWLKIDNNIDCGAGPCTWDQGLSYGTSTINYDDTSLNQLFGSMSIEDCFDDELCQPTVYSAAGDIELDLARMIVLKAICFDADQSVATSYDQGATFISSSLTCSGDYEEKIGLRVSSQVYWQDRGRGHLTEVIENLYNWREYVN